MGNVQKSFTTMGLGVILSNVTAAVIEAEKKAKSSKEIQTLDILRPGQRQDIYIGKVMVIPPSVMDDPQKVPLPLFRGALINLFDSEEAAAYDSHRLAESEFDQLSNKDFATFKDKVFKEGNDKYSCIVMFLPAWANPRDYVGFRFEKDAIKLEQLVRHLIFGAYFNPSLSSLFDTLEETESKLDVKSLQHDHFGPVFDLMNVSNTYPILGKVEKIASTKKPFIRFAKEELDAIKEELISPEETALFEQLSKDITSKVRVASLNVCEGCGAAVEGEDGDLLCEECKSKEKISLEDTTDSSVEVLAQEVAAEAKDMVNDTYLSSSEDAMGLIENVDEGNYTESTEAAIYEVMALKSIPYDLAEAVAERAKEIINVESGSGMHDNLGAEVDIESLADDSLPPDLQAELDAIDEKNGWEKPIVSSKAKHSFIDFYAKCKGCGALVAVDPNTTDEELIFCPACEGVSKELDEHPFKEEAGKTEAECPSCAITEEFVDEKLGSTPENSELLARKIFWKCLDKKDPGSSITMAQIAKVVDANFDALRDAVMLLWRKNIIVAGEKLNTWIKVGKDTDKNTFNGKWPWNVHEASKKQADGTILHVDREYSEPVRKTAPQSEREQVKIKEIKYNEPERKAELPSKKLTSNEPDHSTKLPSLRTGSLKIAVDEPPTTEIEHPAEKGLQSHPDYASSASIEASKQGGLKDFRRLLRSNQESIFLAKSPVSKEYLCEPSGRYNSPYTSSVHKALKFPDYASAAQAAKEHGFKVVSFSPSFSKKDKEWLNGIGIKGKKAERRLRVMDREGVFVIKSFKNEYLAITDEGPEWAWDVADATKFNNSYDAEDAAMEYGGEVIPDPSAEEVSEEQKMDSEFLKGMGIQGKKKDAAGLSYVEQAFGNGLNEIDESNDAADDMLLNESSKIKAPSIKINPKKSHYKKVAFDWMAPDQVLRDFYPELRNQLQTNMHDKDDYHPIKPDEQERGGGANSDIELNDHEAEEKHTLTSPGLVSTESGGVSGAPLRSGERNLRGPFFSDQFYKIHADIPPSQLTIKSSMNKLAVETNRVKIVEGYLTSLSAEIASSLLAAFMVDSKPNFVNIPTEGKIDLKASPAIFMNPMLSREVQDPIVSQLEMFFNTLNDNELTEAINNAWSQSAVWKDDGAKGFLYEIFVRIESVDIDNMSITYKFVANKKEK